MESDFCGHTIKINLKFKPIEPLPSFRSFLGSQEIRVGVQPHLSQSGFI